MYSCAWLLLKASTSRTSLEQAELAATTRVNPFGTQIASLWFKYFRNTLPTWTQLELEGDSPPFLPLHVLQAESGGPAHSLDEYILISMQLVPAACVADRLLARETGKHRLGAA